MSISEQYDLTEILKDSDIIRAIDADISAVLLMNVDIKRRDGHGYAMRPKVNAVAFARLAFIAKTIPNIDPDAFGAIAKEACKQMLAQPSMAERSFHTEGSA